LRNGAAAAPGGAAAVPLFRVWLGPVKTLLKRAG
jgi:hypothetical protein